MVFERPLMLPCKPSPPPRRRPSSAPSTIAYAGATAGRRGSSGRGPRRLQPLWTTTSEWLLVALLGCAPTNHLLPPFLAPPTLTHVEACCLHDLSASPQHGQHAEALALAQRPRDVGM